MYFLACSFLWCILVAIIITVILVWLVLHLINFNSGKRITCSTSVCKKIAILSFNSVKSSKVSDSGIL